jgi:membrane protease YdiL (CAAX protease family)
VSPAAALWSRIVAVTALSLALAVFLSPPRPTGRVAWPAAIALGVLAGLVLFAAAARSRPRLPGYIGSLPALAARVGFFGLWATNEEVVWRRVALGELLATGALPAVAASTVGFALAHRTRRGLHLCTGGVFGGLYLATGVLAASVAAHWAYNLLVAALVAHERASPEPP